MKYIAIIDTDDFKGFEFFEDSNGKYLVTKDAGAVNNEWISLYFKECEQEPKTDRIEYGTDGNAYKLWISNGKEYEPSGDLISRAEAQTALMISKDAYLYIGHPTIRISDAVQAIRELPSIEQEPKTETVTEFADRCRECGAKYGKLLKQGRWIGHREHCENLGVMPSGLGAYEWCSNCDCGIDVREWHRNHYNYCPNCGAKMEGEDKG